MSDETPKLLPCPLAIEDRHRPYIVDEVRGEAWLTSRIAHVQCSCGMRGPERGGDDADVRAAEAWNRRAAPAAPQVVDRDGVLEEAAAAVGMLRVVDYQCSSYGAGLGVKLAGMAAIRALKATPPPAKTTEHVVGDVLPPTPSAPPPTGERTAAEAEADVMAWLRLLAAEHDRAADAFPQIEQEQAARADQNRLMADGIEAGEHIGSSRSPVGTGK